ncbi:MAG: YjbQ family protein [Armatimonadetes bacterium]|nr:YjbQ family protein [Armatimonadota bacterium]
MHMNATALAPTITFEEAIPARSATWRIAAEYLEVTASEAPQLVDITAAVQDAVARSGIAHGHVTIFCRHTTASVVLNENEPLLHEDVKEFLERLASSQGQYRHDDFSIRTENIIEDHGLNAHAHLKHLVLGATMTLPVIERKVALGAWQRIFLLEMDRPKARTLLVQVSGAEIA